MKLKRSITAMVGAAVMAVVPVVVSTATPSQAGTGAGNWRMPTIGCSLPSNPNIGVRWRSTYNTKVTVSSSGTLTQSKVTSVEAYTVGGAAIKGVTASQWYLSNGVWTQGGYSSQTLGGISQSFTFSMPFGYMTRGTLRQTVQARWIAYGVTYLCGSNPSSYATTPFSTSTDGATAY